MNVLFCLRAVGSHGANRLKQSTGQPALGPVSLLYPRSPPAHDCSNVFRGFCFMFL